MAMPRQPRPVPSVGTDDGAPAEAVALRKIVTMYGQLSALAAEDADTASVAALLAQAVRSGVLVLSPTLDVLAAAGVDDAGEDLVERFRAHAGQRGVGPVLAATARTRRAMTLPGSDDPRTITVVAPIVTAGEVTAYLVTVTVEPLTVNGDTRLLLTQHAAMICGIALGRERVMASAVGRARLDLLEGLLRGREHDEGDVGRWARHLGLRDDRPHHVLTMSVTPTDAGPGPGPGADASSAPDALAAIESWLMRRAPEALVAARETEVVAIIPGADPAAALERVKTLSEDCRSAIARRVPTVTVAAGVGVGVGGPSRAAVDVSTSYSQSLRALEIARRTRTGGGVVAFGELGIQRLLLQVPDLSALRAFAREVLSGMLDSSRGDGGEYLSTLAVYFEHNCSPSRAAGWLHLHPNTVSYRVRRIEEMTGLRLSERRDRLMAEVAVEILQPTGQR